MKLSKSSRLNVAIDYVVSELGCFGRYVDSVTNHRAFIRSLWGASGVATLSMASLLMPECRFDVSNTRDEVMASFQEAGEELLSFSPIEEGQLKGDSEVDSALFFGGDDDEYNDDDEDEQNEQNPSEEWHCTFSDMGTEDCEGP